MSLKICHGTNENQVAYPNITQKFSSLFKIIGQCQE